MSPCFVHAFAALHHVADITRVAAKVPWLWKSTTRPSSYSSPPL